MLSNTCLVCVGRSHEEEEKNDSLTGPHQHYLTTEMDPKIPLGQICIAATH